MTMAAKDRRLYYAAEKGDDKQVQQLVGQGADLDCTPHGTNGRTPLITASQEGNVRTVELLLHFGADINKKTDMDGWSAAHLASKYGHLKALQCLIKAGININETDNKGDNFLHLACYRGHLEMIKLLLKQGLSLESPPNKDGKTPLDYLKEEHEYDIVTKQRQECLKALKIVIKDTDNTEYQEVLEKATNDVILSQLEEERRSHAEDTEKFKKEKEKIVSQMKEDQIRHAKHINELEREKARVILQLKEDQISHTKHTKEFEKEKERLLLQLKEDQISHTKQLELEKEKSHSQLKQEQTDRAKDIEKLRKEKESVLSQLEEGHSKYIEELEYIQRLLDQEKETHIQLRLRLKMLQKERTATLKIQDLASVLESTADLQPQWFELGLALGMPDDELKKVEENHSNVTRCLYEVMRYWTKKIGASWEGLIGALRNPLVHQEMVADQIQKQYIQERNIINLKNRVLVLKENEKKVLKDDDCLSEMFVEVDWRVLGLLLGLSDDTLESIQNSCSSKTQCQQSVIEQWISTGQAYWSLMVEALRGPVLGETKLAGNIAKTHLKVEGRGIETRRSSETTGYNETRGSSETKAVYSVDDQDVESNHAVIDNILNVEAKRTGSNPKGIVYAFGINNAAGTDFDVANVKDTFKQELHFAVYRREDMTCSQLASFIKAAATHAYPMSCKYKAFYFAGHGGIDEHRRPYFSAIEEKGEVVSVQDGILAFFESTKKSDSFMFFFDCCLTTKHNEYSPCDKPFSLDTPPRCLVAFATSPGKTSIGFESSGGRWTRKFCNNLKALEVGGTLTKVLDLTIDAVMKGSKDTQPPQYHSSVGPIYLKGLPVHVSDKSQNAFTKIRPELEKLLVSDEKTLTGFSSVLAYFDVINNTVADEVYSTKGTPEGAKTLLDSVEKTIGDDHDILPLVLEKMEKQTNLLSLVSKMREGNEDEEKRMKDLYKDLHECKVKAQELERQKDGISQELEKMEKKMKEQEEQRKTLAKQRKERCNQIKVLLADFEK